MAKIALILFSTLLVAFASGQDCPVNQVYDDCDTACPNYCHKDPTEPCTEQCVARCRCADGYVKRTIDSDECVLASKCSKVKKCGTNQTLHSCGTACPMYCWKADNCICMEACLKDVCRCKPGYLLKSQNSTECILYNQCSGSLDTSSSC